MGDHDAQDVSAATPEDGAAVSPDAQAPEQAPVAEQPQQEGVSTANLVYTEQEGGLRNYPAQKPVKTEDVPAPTAE